MNSPTESMSPLSEWNLLFSSGLAAREKPGADRVDEDQVGAVEPGRVVIDQVERRRRESSDSAGSAPGAGQRSQVQPDRGRARAAVEAEQERPRARGLASSRV